MRIQPSVDFFVHSLEAFAGRPALIVPGRDPVSYLELAERADRLASEIGFERSLVFLEAANTIESLAAYVGCLRAGHVVHLLDSAAPRRNNEELIDRYRPRAVVWNENAAASVEHLDSPAPDLHPDLALLLSTSGSTGSPKLVKLSRANLQSNTDSIRQYLGLNQNDRAVSSLRFHYSYGMSVVNTHLASGGALVLTDLSMQDPVFWDLVRDYRVTNLSGVPAMYQMLSRQPIELGALPHLRFMTQAGGKLSPELVRHFAAACRRHDRSFFVMYGQTEAAPRMSYLPPDLVEDYPDCIGLPVPGGELAIVDGEGKTIEAAGVEGELVYSGPNVMMGYAEDAADLAVDTTPDSLRTGDLAERNNTGLFRITGRVSRFVKPFGLRISLDDLEARLEAAGLEAAVLGDESLIRVLVCPPAPVDSVTRELADRSGLPLTLFEVRAIRSIPRLSSGKVDYRKLQEISAPVPSLRGGSSPIQTVLDFAAAVWTEFWSILTGGTGQWSSVEEIFRVHFPALTITPSDTFVALGGDSIRYVEMTLCLEEHLGSLPSDWHRRTIGQLEALHA